MTFPPVPPSGGLLDPAHHYWVVAAASNKIYSSERNIYVPGGDTAYATWLEAGNTPTPIASEPELWQMLQLYVPWLFPDYLFNGTTFVQPAVNNLTAAQVKAYAAQTRFNKETGNIIFRTHPIKTTRESVAQIDTTVSQGNVNPALTWNWKCADGTFWLIDVPTQRAMATAVGQFVDQCFATEASIIQTATTTNQIDAAFQAISNVYS